VGVVMGKFKVKVSSITSAGADSYPTLEFIRAVMTGTTGIGKNTNVSAVDIYLDDDMDGEFDINKDVLLSPGNETFDPSGVTIVNISTYNPVTGEKLPLLAYERTYFITLDISGSAKVSDFIGLKIESNDNLNIKITPAQRLIQQKGTPFFESTPLLVRHHYAPTTPNVKVNAWINSPTTVNGSWETYTASPRGITHSLYWAGAGGADISLQNDAGAGSTGEATIPGLSLQHGETYRFNVQSFTSDPYANDLVYNSDIGYGEFRVDIHPPSSPGAPVPDQYHKKVAMLSYNVNWTQAQDNVSSVESGVAQYQLQERKDTSPVWKTVEYVSGNSNNVFFKDKEAGHFYYYRVRAQDNAGNWGDWSEISEAAMTGLPSKVLSEVSNYPNPARFDKGDNQTIITYILKEDAEVEIILYDMMGYLVKKWEFEKSQLGGKMGMNQFPWYGKNDDGSSVAKGGYILRIKVKSSEGTVEETRKIGIIR
jgi:hypothetical protein